MFETFSQMSSGSSVELESEPRKGAVSKTLIPRRRSLMSVTKTNQTDYRQVYMSRTAYKTSARWPSDDAGCARVKHSKQSHVDIVILD